MADNNDFEWEIKNTEEERIEVNETNDSNILCGTFNNLILTQDYDSLRSFLKDSLSYSLVTLELLLV